MKGSPKYARRRNSGAVLVFVSALVLGCGSDSSGPDADEGQSPVVGCSNGVLDHGALYRICFPATWNGDLVLYAHGYVAPNQPLALPADQIGGQSISAVVNGLGVAFATTSYRANGLVAAEAVDDMVELDARVSRLYRPDPSRSILVGVSEGGLVTALAVERHPDRFEGGLAACGPVGSFRRQLDYFDDFRVVFDYLFPGVIPGSAVEVPASVTAGWESTYAPAVAAALMAGLDRAQELVDVTGAPVASNDIASIVATAVDVLWYNVIGSADAQARLGGQPFDNSTRVYAGSSDDAALNAGVARYTADPAAVLSLTQFETTGALSKPLVTLHTTGDPIVLLEQESLYADKVGQAGAGSQLVQSAVERYGHCSFQASELLGAFSNLLSMLPQPAAVSRGPG
jgi:pimeloyl-ACP methyl ester carboxylesterase